MRAIWYLSLAMVPLVTCDDVLDRVSTKEPAPAPSAGSPVDSGRVTISGSTTGSEGESIRLSAHVANPRGELEYEWNLNGRGSLVSRESDPENAIVIASTTGRLVVTVTVTEDGDEIGSASQTLRITD